MWTEQYGCRLLIPENASFSVIQTFEDGSCETVRRNASMGEAIHVFRYIVDGMAVHIGMVVRVVITDEDGWIVREWRLERGVVFSTSLA